MDMYKIIQSVTLNSGVVRLTDEQARVRAHKLEVVNGKKGIYRITGPNQFKAGEEIGYEGDLPKVLADNMTAKSEAEAAAKKSAASEEKARAKSEAEAAKARAKLEDDALSAWESDEKLREQHSGDFKAYLAAVLEQLG